MLVNQNRVEISLFIEDVGRASSFIFVYMIIEEMSCIPLYPLLSVDPGKLF